MSDYGPSIKVCRVYEKVSAKGNTYFTGRWGSARINILKSRETADDGTPIWEVLLQEVPATQTTESRRTPREKAEAPAQPQESWHPSIPDDDPVPF